FSFLNLLEVFFLRFRGISRVCEQIETDSRLPWRARLQRREAPAEATLAVDDAGSFVAPFVSAPSPPSPRFASPHPWRRLGFEVLFQRGDDNTISDLQEE
ncbi:MAG: hypothetical protein ABR970_08885, partial [Roseiarcus sp.]